MWHPKIFVKNDFFYILAAAAAAAAAVNKDKSWSLGNAQRLKKSSLTSGGSVGRENSREKQMPMRPRSVNSTFEKQNSRGGVGSNINASGVGGQNKILGKVAFTNFIRILGIFYGYT